VVRRQLGGELTRAVPVSLFSTSSLLHELLVDYKAAPSSTARLESRTLLAQLLGSFLRTHLHCLVDPLLSDGRAALAVPVPSSSRSRASWRGEHPLVGLVEAALGGRPGLELAQRLARGSDTVAHLRASPLGFDVTGPVTGRRVLVVDDTYTTGSRSQSAAACLRLAGAHVVAIVPIGRLIHPDHNDATRALWARQHMEGFELSRCAGPCRLWPPRRAVGTTYGSNSRPSRRDAPARPRAPSTAR
jgi:predicted amidophosphoribosyltransferase